MIREKEKTPIFVLLYPIEERRSHSQAVKNVPKKDAAR